MKKGVSLSTLRRHIKAEKIEYRLVNGKYLVWCDDASGDASSETLPASRSAANGAKGMSGSSPDAALYERAAHGRAAQERVTEDAAKLQGKLDRLERELKKAQEEIAELKMLVALYEERIPGKKHGN